MKKLALLIVVGMVLWNVGRRVSCPGNQIDVMPTPTLVVPASPSVPPPARRHRIEIHRGVVSVAQIPDASLAPPAQPLPPSPFVEPVPPTPPRTPRPPLPAEAALACPDEIDEEEEVPAGPPPAWFNENVKDARSDRVPNEVLTIKGRHSSTKERAEADARLRVDQAVADWLRPEVPRSWVASEPLVDRLIRDRYNEKNDHEYGVTFKTGYRVDFSPERREEIIEVYLKQLGIKRLVILGGGLGFILVCLGAVSGYIRADEATKGYYTNRLRMAAAVGVGAAGMAIYQMLS